MKLTDMTTTPGGRYRSDGPYSAEEFRDDYIIPALENGNVEVNLDGAYGLPVSFLEEAFGGLVRKIGPCALNIVTVTCNDDPRSAQQAVKFMVEAANVR